MRSARSFCLPATLASSGCHARDPDESAQGENDHPHIRHGAPPREELRLGQPQHEHDRRPRLEELLGESEVPERAQRLRDAGV